MVVLESVLGVGGAPLAPDLRQDQCPRWDSLRHVDLAFRLEEEFSVEFSADELGEITSVGAILAVLERKRG